MPIPGCVLRDCGEEACRRRNTLNLQAITCYFRQYGLGLSSRMILRAAVQTLVRHGVVQDWDAHREIW